MTQKNEFDIAVIGGGLIGLTQALKLAQAGLKVLCLDAAKGHQKADDRTTAISYGSSKILETIGIWEKLLPLACPIKDIQILDGKSPVLLDFKSSDAFKNSNDDNAFGWIIENTILKDVLFKKIANTKNLTFFNNTKLSKIDIAGDSAILSTANNELFQCKLIIGADGRNSFVRNFFNIPTKQWDYGQTALVCIIEHEKPHNNIAIEHFRNDGPFAVLPMLPNGDIHRSSVVWSFHSKEKHYQQTAWANNTTLLKTTLEERLPEFYGTITNISAIQFYPLTFNHAYTYVFDRVALVGDAAHGIHPIAGQGLNLGLRDIGALSDLLIKADDISSEKILDQYNKQRASDTISMAAATDLLNRLFSTDVKPIGKIRKLGLRAVSKSKIAKLFFMKQAMGSK